MLHTSDFAGLPPSAERLAAIGALQARMRDDLSKSRRAPYRQLAVLNAGFYLAALTLAAALLRLFRGPEPDAVDCDLALAYAHVPEMAIHKKIELKAFLARHYVGKGIDLGCGNGIVGGILMRHAGFGHLHGVDMTPQPEYASAQGYADYTSGSVEDIPLPSRSFDFAISICVLEHVLGLDSALREAARVLKPGGSFCFSTVAPAFRSSTAGYRLRALIGARRAAERFADYKDLHATQHHYRSPDQWRSALAKVGFTDVEIWPIFSRRQLLIYDIMNYNSYVLQLFACETLARWYGRFPKLASAGRWATRIVCAAVTARPATTEDATHFFIAARNRA